MYDYKVSKIIVLDLLEIIKEIDALKYKIFQKVFGNNILFRHIMQMEVYMSQYKECSSCKGLAEECVITAVEEEL